VGIRCSQKADNSARKMKSQWKSETVARRRKKQRGGERSKYKGIHLHQTPSVKKSIQVVDTASCGLKVAHTTSIPNTSKLH